MSKLLLIVATNPKTGKHVDLQYPTISIAKKHNPHLINFRVKRTIR
jgi:hypothetical protein